MQQISSTFSFKHVIKMLIFCVIFIIILSILNKMIVKQNYYARNWNTIYNNDQLDVVFFGSSHANKSFKADYLTDIGINSVVISSNSESIISTYYNVKEVIKNTKPDTIVIELYKLFYDNQELNNDPKVRYFNMQNTLGMKFGYNKLCKIFKTNEPNGYLMNLVPIVAYHTEWNNMGAFIDNYLFNVNIKENHSRGYIKLNRVIDQDTWNKSDFIAENIDISKSDIEGRYIPDDNIEILKDINELCDENNINVIYVKTPVARNYLAESKSLEALSDSLNIRLIDYNLLLGDLELKQTDFYDSGHLSESGSMKLTEYLLCNTLIKEMGYSVDYTYLESTLAIKEKRILQYNGNYSYVIDTYAKDILYAFYLYKDGELIDEQSYSTNNTYMFSPSGKGEYKVKWFVQRNPINDNEDDVTVINKQSGYFQRLIIE